jgi:pimeloyl-ACP methyl ester carboxylesterase
LFVAVLLFVAWQGFGFYVAYDYLSRNHHDLQPLESPEDRGLQSVDVVIPVAGSSQPPLELAGWFLPADSRSEHFQGGAVIIMLHGFGSSKAKIWEHPEDDYAASLFDQGAESLVRAGFHVLMFDFRNHGDSGDRGVVTLGYREAEDVVAAVRWVRERLPQIEPTVDPNRIGIRAESMGGPAALLAMAHSVGSHVDAAWLDSAFATADDAVEDFLHHHDVPGWVMPPVKFWLQQLAGVDFTRVQPVRLLQEISTPVLLTHSVDDTMIRIRHFERYVAASRRLANVETWRVAGVQHNRLWQVDGYLQRQIDFFRRHLGEAGEQWQAGGVDAQAVGAP